MDYKQIPNFTAYEIYADGRIIRRKWKTPKGVNLKRVVLKQTIDKHGYRTVMLMDNQGKYKRFYVHRLVWTAFMGEIPKGIEIDHIDGRRSGIDENGVDANSLQNLRAVTHKQNSNNPCALEKYKRANSLSAGKFDRERLAAAKGKERYEQLKQLYLQLYNDHGKVNVWLMMTQGHCGYPRACKVVAAMRGMALGNLNKK